MTVAISHDPRNIARAKEAFLIAYRANGNVSEACRQAHIGRRTAYDWREADPAFRAAWEEAHEVAVDALEEEARRRALDQSDRLLEFLLKANRPEKYRETYRFEHRNTDDETLLRRAAAVAARIRELMGGDREPPALPGELVDERSDPLPG